MSWTESKPTSSRRELNMSERLTVDEFLALIDRPASVGSLVAAGDAEEYLTLVSFLVERQNH